MTPPTLDYVRVLYTGGVRFRSAGGVVTGLAMAALAVGATLAAAGRVGGPVSGTGRLALSGGAVVAAAAAVWVLSGVVTDRYSRFEVTIAGIHHGRRLVPWERVTRVFAAGTPAGPTVRLFYTRKWGDRTTVTDGLPSAPSISVTDYEHLVDRLRREVLPAHPHLQVGGYEPLRTLAPST